MEEVKSPISKPHLYINHYSCTNCNSKYFYCSVNISVLLNKLLLHPSTPTQKPIELLQMSTDTVQNSLVKFSQTLLIQSVTFRL